MYFYIVFIVTNRTWILLLWLWLESLSLLQLHRLIDLNWQRFSVVRISLFWTWNTEIRVKIGSFAFLSGCSRCHKRRLMAAHTTVGVSRVVRVVRSSHRIYVRSRILFSQLHNLLIDFNWNLFKLIRKLLSFLITGNLLPSWSLLSSLNVDRAFTLLLNV